MEYEIEDETLFDHASTNPSLESARQKLRNRSGEGGETTLKPGLRSAGAGRQVS